MRSTREVAVLIRRGAQVLVAHRATDGYWHVIAGQVEPCESDLEAAMRELAEETGFASASLVDLALPQRYAVPDEMREQYAAGVSEVIVHSFAVDVPDDWEPTLNEEHDDYRWCGVEEAVSLLHWPEARESMRAFSDFTSPHSPGT